MYQEAELRGYLTSEETLTGTLTDTQGLSGVLSAGVGAAGDYNNLINKPRINNIVIEGNKTPLQYTPDAFSFLNVANRKFYIPQGALILFLLTALG